MAVAKTDLEIKLLTALKRIAAYQPPDRLRRGAENIGLTAEEHIEMAYENIQAEAKNAVRGVRVARITA